MFKFYLLAAENQKHHAQEFQEHALADMQRREQQITDVIDRGVEEVRRRNEEKLKTERAQREAVIDEI